MRRKFLSAIGLASVLLLVLLNAGCGGGPAAAKATDLEKTKAGLYVAQDEGLFKAEGLNVTIDSLVSSADATAGQNDGKYDITAGNSVSYIQARVLEEHGMSPREVHFVPLNFPEMGQDLERHVISAARLPEPFGSADQETMGLQQLTDLDQGATSNFPVGWYVVTKAWAQKYPHTLAAFLTALRQGQEICDTDRHAVELAMEKLPSPYTVPPAIAAMMSLETYPLNIAPDVDRARVQRVADAMYETQMLTQRFQVSSMLN